MPTVTTDHLRAASDRIDAWLPQTQCTLCGYPRCRAYAEAVARGEADINRCPPGGDVTIEALAKLLKRPFKPLDPACGVPTPRLLAIIDEPECIGCTLCLTACPVDAILGAAKKMHTVIATECTGCALCLEPCPVDCIALVPYPCEDNQGDWPWPQYSREQSERARARTEARLRRLGQRHETRAARQAPRTAAMPSRHNDDARNATKAEIRMEIRAAVKRVRAKKMQLRASDRNSREG